MPSSPSPDAAAEGEAWQNKVSSARAALAGLFDGAVIMVGGFGSSGLPDALIHAVLDTQVRDLVVVSNNAGFDREGVALLIAERRVRKLVCSYPLTEGATDFRTAYRKGEIELELVPQGTLAERIRCAGAGIGGFLSPVGVGTAFEQGRRIVEVDGRKYLLELPLGADFALIRAALADRVGNLVYRHAARNFNPVMATAASTVVAQVDRVTATGTLAPDHVHTPGIFVDHLVPVSS